MIIFQLSYSLYFGTSTSSVRRNSVHARVSTLDSHIHGNDIGYIYFHDKNQ